VFLDYDQQELDDAYDQAVYAPNRAQVNSRLACASELARQRLLHDARDDVGRAAGRKADHDAHRPAGIILRDSAAKPQRSGADTGARRIGRTLYGPAVVLPPTFCRKSM